MKKILLIGLFVVIGTYTFARDTVVPVSSLPANAQNFISQNFAGKTATYVEADWNEYEVYLDNGTEIKFHGNGDWDEVKCYQGVPKSILPNVISSQLDAMFTDVAVVEVDKEYGNFEIQMANRMKVYFSANGKLIGQKYDD